MSRGLGKIERTILGALQAMKRPYVVLWELVLLVDGRLSTTDLGGQTISELWGVSRARHWDSSICTPHPQRRNVLGFWVEHEASCYAPEPSRSVQEAVSRAVRALARKGLVRCAYAGNRPKCLLVYLPSTDDSHLPKAEREKLEIKVAVLFGIKRRGRRRNM
jgi:hypothetical protein